MSVGRQVTFQHLPTELRLKIWTCLSCPRTAVIRRKFAEKTQYLASPGPVPLALHICRESRQNALFQGQYVAAFSVDDANPSAPPTQEEFESMREILGLSIRDSYRPPAPPLSITHYFPVPPYIWINFNLDTIRISEDALSLVKAEERGQIRKAIVEVTDTFCFLNFSLKDMSDMKNLEQLDILSFVDLYSWGWSLGGVTSEFETWFGSQDGWVCPEVRIIEEATGEEMNTLNYTQKAAALRARGGRGGRGGRSGRGVGRGTGEAGERGQ